MTNHDPAIEQYWALNPLRFDILDRLVYSQSYTEQQGHQVTVELRLRIGEREEDDRRRLRIVCTGVKDLRLQFGGFMHFPRITIRSIRDWQWEDLRYEVADEEQGTFSLYCRAFQALLEEVAATD